MSDINWQPIRRPSGGDLLKSLVLADAWNHVDLEKALSGDLSKRVKEGQAHWVTVKEGPLSGRHLLIEGARPASGEQSKGRILAGKGIPAHVIEKITGATHAHHLKHEQDYSSWSDEDLNAEHKKGAEAIKARHNEERKKHQLNAADIAAERTRVQSMRKSKKKEEAWSAVESRFNDHLKAGNEMAGRHWQEEHDHGTKSGTALELGRRREAREKQAEAEREKAQLAHVHGKLKDKAGYEDFLNKVHDEMLIHHSTLNRANVSVDRAREAGDRLERLKKAHELAHKAAKENGIEGLPEMPDFEKMSEETKQKREEARKKREEAEANINYHIYHHKDNKFVGVHGKRVHFEGAEHLHLFHHKDEDGKIHVISDARTGARMGSGTSKEKAIQNVQEALNKHGLEKVYKLMDQMVDRFGESPSWETNMKAGPSKPPKTRAKKEATEEKNGPDADELMQKHGLSTTYMHESTRPEGVTGPVVVSQRPLPGDHSWTGDRSGNGSYYATGNPEEYGKAWAKLGASHVKYVNNEDTRKLVHEKLREKGIDPEKASSPEMYRKALQAFKMEHLHKDDVNKSLEGGASMSDINWQPIYRPNGADLLKSLVLADAWNRVDIEKSALTKEQRENTGEMHYALGGGRFPMPDAKHARLAYDMAARSEHAGNISHEEAEEVRRKAKARLQELGEPMGEK